MLKFAKIFPAFPIFFFCSKTSGHPNPTENFIFYNFLNRTDVLTIELMNSDYEN
jgi:hypothetical protein